MTTDTVHRPMPTTMADVRQHFMPAEPESTVTAARRGLSRLDGLVAAAVNQLDDHDRQARQRAAELADAAIAGADLERHQLTLVDIERPTLVEALDQLRRSRAVVQHRLTAAQQSDPIHLSWVAECRRTVDEWQLIRSSDDPTAAMFEFVQRHPQPE